MNQATSPILRLSSFAIATTIVFVAACTANAPKPCVGRAMADDNVVMSDSTLTSKGCQATAYLDSVGTDTSTDSVGTDTQFTTLYELDSVGTDTM